MNILRDIDVKNFRGLDKLEISGFKNINLFIGKNNTGKSSLLEAIFLTLGMSNPLLPTNINRMRGLNIKSADDFKFLFYKVRLENTPEFKGVFSDDSIRSLKLSPLFTKPVGQLLQADLIEASTSVSKITGLELSFGCTIDNSVRSRRYKSQLVFDASGLRQILNQDYKEDRHAVFIGGGSFDEAGTLARYSEIVKKKQIAVVLHALRNIDPKIEEIHSLPDGIYFSYEDIGELIPSNITGDGVRKFLNIVTTIAERKGSTVLIDEIENGLHYSAHRALWKAIFSISKEFEVQLFITSHNIETLRYMTELLGEKEYNSYQNDVGVFKIANTKKAGLKAYKYTYEGFKDAIETETEIR